MAFMLAAESMELFRSANETEFIAAVAIPLLAGIILVTLLAAARWLRALFLGGVICGLIVPTSVLILSAAIRQASGGEILGSLFALSVLWPFAATPMGLAGCVFGALGASWIRFRSRSLHMSERLVIESALLGTALGGLVPISALVWGEGKREKVLADVPAWAVSGLVCAFLVVYALRKQGLLFEVSPTSSNQGP